MIWQPIETSPRDGTKFLTLRRNQKTGIREPVIAYWRLTAYSNQWQLVGATERYATYWMPLPPPPEAP